MTTQTINPESYNYLARQLRLALDDAPGGEKAWVPLRRSLAVAILEHLENGEFLQVRLAWGRAMMVNLLDENPKPALPDIAQNESAQPSAAAKPIPSPWQGMDRQERIAAIRAARYAGASFSWLPDKRTWRRHYPEAFAQNGEVQS